MRARPDQIFVHAIHIDAALLALPARAVTALRVDKDSNVVPVDAEFYAFAARYPNLRLLKMGPWSYTSVPGHLPLHPVPFSKLTTFCVAWENNTWLTVDSLFGVLSMMPALKKLAFGITDMRMLDDLDDHELRAQSFPTPACSLTHLVVHDDGDANFWHYSLLLSRSHDTLEHIGLHWIFDSEGGVEIREALLQCTRVRHLTLEGNEFDNALIISVCPRLQTLALTAAPTEAEMAALQAPLFSLELANCFGDTPQQFVARVSARYYSPYAVAWDDLFRFYHWALAARNGGVSRTARSLQGPAYSPLYRAYTTCDVFVAHSIDGVPRFHTFPRSYG